MYWVVEKELAGRDGPAEHPWSLEEFVAAGIRAIVSISDDGDDAQIKRAGLAHLRVRLAAEEMTSRPVRLRFQRKLTEVVSFIDRVRRQRGGVLVHCPYGADHTGAMLACYLVATRGMIATDAIRTVRRANPNALMQPGFEELVREFEWSMRNRRPNSVMFTVT